MDNFLHDLVYKHDIDIIVHWDDPFLAVNGSDAYTVKRASGGFSREDRLNVATTPKRCHCVFSS